jgi:PAS domain S-box-containing protein
VPGPDRPTYYVATLAATAAACVLMVVGAALAFAAVRGVGIADALAGQVQSTNLAAEKLLSTLKDAETGQRGYLLTGDLDYLEPYDAARVRIPEDIGRLRAMPLKYPERDAVMDRLEALVGGKMDELGRTIALRLSGDATTALEVVRTNSGKDLMDAIRAEIRRLEVGADELFAQPRSRPKGAVEGALGSAIIACCLMGWVGHAHRRARSHVRSDQARLEQFTRAFGMAHGMICQMDGTITFWSEGSEQLYGFAPAEALGKIRHDLLSTSFTTSLADIETELRRSGRWSGSLSHRHKDGAELHVTCVWVLHHGKANEPDSVIILNTDTTSLRQAEMARERDNILLRTVVETAPGVIFAKDLQGRMLLANQRALDLIGKPWSEVEGRTDSEFLDDPAQGGAIMATDLHLMETDTARSVDEFVGNEDGSSRVWLSSKAPLHDGTGTVIGLVGVSVEITDRKRAEEDLQRTVHELNHRAKNNLVTMQVIIAQTLKGFDPVVLRNLEARLLALASLHDILARSKWIGADLADIVAGTTQAHGGESRFRVSGPPLRLNPGAAQALALGLHELAANAVRHGALRVPTGVVHLRWEITGANERHLLLNWTERGGPPVEAPSYRGFGRRLIERGLAQDLQASVRLVFDPAGVSCSVEAPVPNVATLGGTVPFPAVGDLRAAI